MKVLQFFSCDQTYEMYNMAEIEKEEMCHLLAREVFIRWQHLIFSFIYMIKLYEGDCAVLLICWAVRL